MATQTKPKSSGSFVTITADAAGRCVKSTITGYGLPPGNANNCLRAINYWHNNPTNATVTAQAQKIASANGIQLQEV